MIYILLKMSNPRTSPVYLMGWTIQQLQLQTKYPTVGTSNFHACFFLIFVIIIY